MKNLYDFGISQDDPRVETKFLDLTNTNLLCVASGGEVPLSLLANHDVKIKALDVSENQIRLCRLKLAAALMLEPFEAAVFLGYKRDLKNCRGKYFRKILEELPADDARFWKENSRRMIKGPIRASRFEKYLSLFCRFVKSILGSRRVAVLFDLESEESRQNYFDRYLDKKIIFWIFKVAFSPIIYKERGLSQQALIHQNGQDMAGMFYSRFRDFLTATSPLSNFYLQFYLMGEILYDDAMPDFLKPDGLYNIRKRKENLNFEIRSIQQEVAETDRLSYENYALSNICDWITEDEMNFLLNTISRKSQHKFKMLIRYIHRNPVDDKVRESGICFNALSSECTRNIDRFPFYSLISAEKL
jgi:S-adenosylmethionine-diacylglycerol 3-amino-3-carboxypropyl transferase